MPRPHINPSGSIHIPERPASTERCIPMDFRTDWGLRRVFDGYRHLQETRIIERLQIRIDGGTPPHRFVLAYLRGSDTVCRFDRRPEILKPTTRLYETFGRPLDKAADEWTIWDKEEWERSRDFSSHCEFDMKLPFDTDLLLILSACCALATDPQAQNYALFRYNCYFFSWTITMVVARHIHPFADLSLDGVIKHTSVAAEMRGVTDAMTERTTTGLLKLVLRIVTVVREQMGETLNPGLSKRELFAWGLPTELFCALMGSGFKIRLLAGLESQLKLKVHNQLVVQAHKLLEKVLEKQTSIKELGSKRLWISELLPDFQVLFRTEIIKIIWGSLLTIVSECYVPVGSTDVKDHGSTRYRLSHKVWGRNVAQFTQVWTLGLQRALPSAHAAVIGISESADFTNEEDMHRKTFNAAFRAVRTASLEGGREVVELTSQTLNNPERDRMWGTVWERWDDLWNSVEDDCRNTVVALLMKSVDDLMKLGATALMVVLRNDDSRPLVATFTPQFQAKERAAQVITLSDIQDNIIASIRSSYPRAMASDSYVESIKEDMAKIWNMSQDYFQTRLSNLFRS